MEKQEHGETIVDGNHDLRKSGHDGNEKSVAEKTKERREEKGRDNADPIVEENDEKGR